MIWWGTTKFEINTMRQTATSQRTEFRSKSLLGLLCLFRSVMRWQMAYTMFFFRWKFTWNYLKPMLRSDHPERIWLIFISYPLFVTQTRLRKRMTRNGERTQRKLSGIALFLPHLCTCRLHTLVKSLQKFLISSHMSTISFCIHRILMSICASMSSIDGATESAFHLLSTDGSKRRRRVDVSRLPIPAI